MRTENCVKMFPDVEYMLICERIGEYRLVPLLSFDQPPLRLSIHGQDPNLQNRAIGASWRGNRGSW